MTRIAPLELGPPVGWPVQYRVSGPDEEKVRDLALSLAKTMGESPSVTRINFDWIEPARAVHVKIDQDKARLLGLSSQAVANALQGVATGQTVTQVRDDIYLVDVVARAKDEQRMSLDTLQSLQLPLPDGGVAPLSQIATFEFGLERPLIWRRDRMPTLTVQADPAPGLTPETAVAALAPAVAALNASLPPSYHIATGGTVEESAEVTGLRLCAHSADAVSHDHILDDPAAELQQNVSRPGDRADGPHRHHRGFAHRQQAAWASSRSSASCRCSV